MLAIAPYILEWQAKVDSAWGKSAQDWAAGSRDEFDKLVDKGIDKVKGKIEEEVLGQMSPDALQKAALKALLPRAIFGMLTWFERLSSLQLIWEAVKPSHVASDYQQAVLSGEAALYPPLYQKLQSELPDTMRAYRELQLQPYPAIVP